MEDIDTHETIEMDPVFLINRIPTEPEYSRAAEYNVPISVIITEELCPSLEEFVKWQFENVPSLRLLNCFYVKTPLLRLVISEMKTSYRQHLEDLKESIESQKRLQPMIDGYLSAFANPEKKSDGPATQITDILNSLFRRNQSGEDPYGSVPR
jgi:hypothetical protein